MERKTVKLLGFSIDTFDLESAISYAKSLIDSKKGGQIVTINPEMIENGLENTGFAKILYEADLVLPDGVGIQLGLKIIGHETKKIPGIEFSHKLLEVCAKNSYSVGLVGAKPNIIQKACENLKTEINNLNIVYVQDGYYKNVNDVYWTLGEQNPQVILVALGSPKQEIFIKNYRKNHPETLMIGVGGSFDVWSGEVKRAPEFFQKFGLEWLYRTIMEPERIFRIFPTLPRFMLRVLLSRKK